MVRTAVDVAVDAQLLVEVLHHGGGELAAVVRVDRRRDGVVADPVVEEGQRGDLSLLRRLRGDPDEVREGVDHDQGVPVPVDVGRVRPHQVDVQARAHVLRLRQGPEGHPGVVVGNVVL